MSMLLRCLSVGVRPFAVHSVTASSCFPTCVRVVSYGSARARQDRLRALDLPQTRARRPPREAWKAP